MINLVFVLSLAVFLAAVLAWGFTNLTRENWQFLAAIPVQKEDSGKWSGMNLTTYGLINAFAYLFGIALMFVLLGAIAVPVRAIYGLVVCVLVVAMPASRLIARIVEKKAHTFTVGGASFAGLLAAPAAVFAINELSTLAGSPSIPMLPALAALSIGYSFGEGLGRLACISFGCCYGKPWSEAHPVLRALFMNRSFVFRGKTKKIAYESGLDGERVIPIQAVTSVIYVSVGLVGLMAYLASTYGPAFVFIVVATQGWRAVSEIFRSDYRGGGSVSAYQKLAGLAMVLSCVVALTVPGGSARIPEPDVVAGLSSIWHPGILLSFQALGVFVFLFMGRSRVTGATLSFHVKAERI